ncbi:MAG: type II secretion system F family protein [Actinobacteria bacterium]|nr:MAG: type II secretion system F family protein [Actinomycetota bacterium]
MPLLILALASLGAAVFYVTEFVSAPARERRNLVTRAAQYGRMRVLHERELPRFSERALAPIVQRLARLMLRVNPRMSLESVAKKLAAAGMRRTTPTTFLAIRGFCGIAGLVLGLLVMSSAKAQTGMLSMLLFTVLGFFGPSYWLTLKARRRADLVASELPDALDLLAVSVEAGMGFDGAIAKLTEHMQGPLIDEFELALGEIRVGEGRPDALKRIAERVPAQEMSSFVRAIVQADQLGISLGRILRVQATDARNKRQAAAEEKAMKAPIKMLFPLVLFIFPAMFIVVLGPAFLNLSQLFQF